MMVRRLLLVAGLVVVGVLAPAAGAGAATNFIFTFAGTGAAGFSGDGGPATSAQLSLPFGVAVAPDGGVLIADTGNRRVRRVSTAGTITTIAGNGTPGFSGDGGPATSAQLSLPFGVAVAADGSVLIADTTNHRVRRVSTAGTITTIAGNGTPGFSGDGGPATDAQLANPFAVAVAPDGSVLVAEQGNHRVRRVSPAGTITTIAGTGTPGFSGDGGPATSAQLNVPSGLAAAADGSVLIADQGNQRVRRVSPAGTITTIAGTGTPGFSGDGGPATDAELRCPIGVAVAADGSAVIADACNSRVRRVSFAGTITTIAGTGTPGFSGDGGPATDAQLDEPVGVAVAQNGNVLIADSQHRVRRVDAGLQPMSLLATPTSEGDVRVVALCAQRRGCSGILKATLPPLGLPLALRAFRLRSGEQATYVLRMPAFLRPRILSGRVVPRVTAYSYTGKVLASTRVQPAD